jgi:hypothetical protein
VWVARLVVMWRVALTLPAAGTLDLCSALVALTFALQPGVTTETARSARSNDNLFFKFLVIFTFRQL